MAISYGPEALDVANRIFSLLPERYRRNAFTRKIDSTIPETDFSANSFEGIRSEEIESLLLRYLDPVEMWRRNCFLWRLVNPAYFRNYDLNSKEDRYIVQSLVAAEYNLWKSGGRPTESHSVLPAPLTQHTVAVLKANRYHSFEDFCCRKGALVLKSN